MALTVGTAFNMLLLGQFVFVYAGRPGWPRYFHQSRTHLVAIRPMYRHTNHPVVPAIRGEPSASARACEEYRKIMKKMTRGAVFGGNQVEESELPYMVAVGYNSSRTSDVIWGCGGSLIHERYVLTAAHCITEPAGRGMFVAVVRLGMTVIPDGTRLPSDYAVQQAITHPGHHPDFKYHDVGLLRTDRKVSLSFSVYPVCLVPAATPPPLHGTTVQVAGWGSTARLGYPRSERLLKASVKIVNSRLCKDRFKSLRESSLPRGITKDMICAAHPTRKSGACLGDSGGPLIWRNASSGEDTLIGIVSFGQVPCGGSVPGVCSSVAEALPWIESIVWP